MMWKIMRWYEELFFDTIIWKNIRTIMLRQNDMKDNMIQFKKMWEQ